MHSSTHFGIGSDVAFREIDEEAVVLNLESGTYYGLNAVGARAWALFAAGRSLGEALIELQNEFDVTAEVLERDVTIWLETLLNKGLLERRDSPLPATETT